MAQEDLRDVPVTKYLAAHATPNGNHKSFWKSNLGTAVFVIIIGQALTVGGVVTAMYFRVSSMSEWKAETDATLKRMDALGSFSAQNQLKVQTEKIAELNIRLRSVEDDTKHFDVMEAENRRITQDMEELKAKLKEKK
jgi:hypothetical protein